MGSSERNQLLILTLILGLCLASWSSNWFLVSGKGVYTEGPEREPTIVIEYQIDSSSETVTVSLDNATPLLTYWSQRENIVGDENAAQNTAEPTEAENDVKPCGNSCLDKVRSYTALAMTVSYTHLTLPTKRIV